LRLDIVKEALLELKSAEAGGVLSVTRTPILIPQNKHGPTDYEYITNKIAEAGIDITNTPLMHRFFSEERISHMKIHGTDRTNGMNLLAHHEGRDGEWLAMIEHGLKIFETARTTYVAPLTPKHAYDLLKASSYAVEIYDVRGLMPCQPSRNETNSFSNGHHVFLVPPKSALIAVVSR
jgi:hypothetical protein